MFFHHFIFHFKRIEMRREATLRGLRLTPAEMRSETVQWCVNRVVCLENRAGRMEAHLFSRVGDANSEARAVEVEVLRLREAWETLDALALRIINSRDNIERQ